GGPDRPGLRAGLPRPGGPWRSERRARPLAPKNSRDGVDNPAGCATITTARPQRGAGLPPQAEPYHLVRAFLPFVVSRWDGGGAVPVGPFLYRDDARHGYRNAV